MDAMKTKIKSLMVEQKHIIDNMESGEIFVKQSPSDEKETSRIAIEKLKDDRLSYGIRLNFALMMIPLEKANRVALFSAKYALENHSHPNNLLKWALSKLHSFADGQASKEEVVEVLSLLKAFHKKSIVKHSSGYLDPLKPSNEENIARMLVIISTDFIESNERSCGFTCSSIGAWIASEIGIETKDITEKAHVDFLIRLLERPSFKLL